MTRWIILLLCGFLSFGCAIIFPEQKQPMTQEQQVANQGQQDQDLFIRSVSALLTSGTTAALQQFLVDYPASDQAANARALIVSARELEQCRSDNVKLNSAVTTQQKTSAELEVENQQLRETIEQLKSLLIQLEQRTN